LTIQVVVVLARQLSNSSPSVLSRALTAYRQLELLEAPRPRPRATCPRQLKLLTAAELNRLVAGYRRGATVYELADQFGIRRATVAEHLKRHGVTMRYQSSTQADVDDMVRLYQAGLSLVAVGERLDFAARTVLRHIQLRGVQTRDFHGRCAINLSIHRDATVFTDSSATNVAVSFVDAASQPLSGRSATVAWQTDPSLTQQMPSAHPPTRRERRRDHRRRHS
jgi:DNA-binding transcriptional ArsR family regulator